MAPDDIIASHIVDSEVDCSLKCVEEQSCVGYNYREKSYNDVPNCQISNKIRGIDAEHGEWTFYLLMESVSKMFVIY